MMLSIIIVSWNVKGLLQECLESVFSSRVSFLFEVIVIDNASTDGTLEMIKRLFPQITLIENEGNVGFAYANNQGIKVSKGQYILLLNPDTKLFPLTLQDSIDFMLNHPCCGVMGPKLLNSDKSLQPSVRQFPTCCSQSFILLKLHHISLKFPCLISYFAVNFDYEKQQLVDQVMGAYFLVPRSVFDEIGLLDERFFIWFEEVDFCKRVKKTGYAIIYTPSVSVIHHQSQSFAQVLSVKKQGMFNKSLCAYMRKHHGIGCYVWLSFLSYISLVMAYTLSFIKKR